MTQTMRVVALAIAAAMGLAACATSGPADEESAAWRKYSQMLQQRYAASVDPLAPHNVVEYVLGVNAFTGADSIVAGWFTGATSEFDAAAGEHRNYATFEIRSSIVGGASGVITVDIGASGQGPSIDDAVRGADTCVIFLTQTPGGWALVDGEYAIATTDKAGRLSMPLVAPGAEASYLASVTDVADIAAIAIAGHLSNIDEIGGDLVDDAVEELTGELG